MDKPTASKILTALDNSAERLQKLAATGKLNPKTAEDIVLQIDTLADKIQVAAYGEAGLAAFKSKLSVQNKTAKVIQKDSDEKYMDTYDNPNKVIESDSDESFMHKTDASFNAKAIDNYDQDRTTTVSERDEFAVRDLSEWADSTKKQPSWARGPAGKSTKQGSTSPAKTWGQ